jgi:hypothetical protein
LVVARALAFTDGIEAINGVQNILPMNGPQVVTSSVS